MRSHHLLILLTHPEWEGYYINLDLHQLIPVYPSPLASVYQMIMTGFNYTETNGSSRSKLTLVAGFL